MEEINEEVYSTIFSALKHGVRRRILWMLSEGQKSFTNLYETLEITSSHLNYHLESLGELVTKDDGVYRLSVFGKAAVEMMQNIESPPKLGVLSLEQNRFRSITSILLVCLIAVSGLLVNQYSVNQEMGIEMANSIQSEASMLESESLSNLFDLITKIWREKTVTIVDRYELNYMYSTDRSILYKTGMDDLGKAVMVFYVPVDGAQLRIYAAHFYMPTDFYQPFVIQKGNALRNESSVLIYEQQFGDMLAQKWRSEIFWTANSTGGGNYYEVSIPSSGWYTLSLVGPITYSGSDYDVGYMWETKSIWKDVDGFSTNVQCILLKDGENSFFGVEEYEINHYWKWSFDEASTDT